MNSTKPSASSRLPLIITIILTITVLLIQPNPAEAHGIKHDSCSGETKGECYNNSEATKYKIIAIFTILIASVAGIGLPMFSQGLLPILRPESNAFVIVKPLAAGVILSTGFMHVLPDSWHDLTSECLPKQPWHEFPISTFVAMVTAVFTMMMDSLATALLKKRGGLYQHHHHHNCGGSVELTLPEVVSDGEIKVDNGEDDEKSSQLLRYRIVAQVLELGIVVHSVVIGLSMGVSNNHCIIRPLIAAMCLHQFFEGMGLGGCILQAEYKFTTKFVLATFFSITTPFGIALGMGIINFYNQNSPGALIVVGMLNAISAGLLIYMALVNLLAADFMSPRLQSDIKLQLQGYIAVFIGMTSMSIMAKWA